jgi:hypothetical protein
MNTRSIIAIAGATLALTATALAHVSYSGGPARSESAVVAPAPAPNLLPARAPWWGSPRTGNVVFINGIPR